MNTFDSGKTTLAINLGEVLQAQGQKVEYFKPISGHNYWMRYEHTKRCFDAGLLASKDAMDVRSKLSTRAELALSNPIHSLFVPAQSRRPLKNVTSTLGIAGWSSVLVAERFSMPENGSIDTSVLLAEDLVESEEVIIDLEDIGKLTREASVIPIRSFEDAQQFEFQHFENHVSASFAEVEKLADWVVIESFNDSPWPWDGLTTVDAVLVAGPGVVFSYDPEKFRKASYLMSRGGLPIREVTFNRIVDLIRPLVHLRRKPGIALGPHQVDRLLDVHGKE
jgi:predicted P-loop ATPase/GTPase